MIFFDNLWNLFSKPFLVSTDSATNPENTKSDDDVEQFSIEGIERSRANIRSEIANGTDLNAIVEAFVNGVVGERINIQSRIKGETDLNEDIEDYIDWWAEKDNCGTRGEWHFDGMLRAIIRFMKQDGGVVIRKHINMKWDIPIRYELLEIGMIDTRRDFSEPEWVNGFKKDEYGRISHIKIYKDQERRESTSISMDEVIYFAPVWISLSQYSAISPLSGVFNVSDKLTSYSNAELESAKHRALSGVYWATELYDNVTKAMRNLKDTTADKFKAIIENISKKGIKPHGSTAIPKDDKIYTVDHKSDTVYESLNNNSKKSMASGVGLGAQVVFRDVEKVNYSSAKYNNGLDNIKFGVEFDDLNNKVIKPILKEVIGYGVVTGALDIPDYFIKPRLYNKFEIMRAQYIDIEPVKTATANAKKIETGEETLQDIQAKKGIDWKVTIRKKLEVEKFERELRVELEVPTQEDLDRKKEAELLKSSTGTKQEQG